VSHEKLAAAIRMTIADIDEEFTASEPLFELGAQRDFDFIETAAAASILQSFYTGIENLALYLCKTLDGAVPQSPSWHRELLDAASAPTAKRAAIVSQATRDRLVTYLDFRHVVRHGYARRLRSDRTRELFLAAPKVWEEARKDLERFIASLLGD
jgi:hypothetical protein